MYLRHASGLLRGPYGHAAGRGQQYADPPLRLLTYAMNPTPPGPEWHPPNGVKGARRTVSRTQARRRLRERQVLSEGNPSPKKGAFHGRSAAVILTSSPAASW
jgi:hypothetical protein